MTSAKTIIRQVLDGVDDNASFEDIQRLIRQREREILPPHLIEHRQLAEAGKQLAGEVWPREDFSDWEHRFRYSV